MIRRLPLYLTIYLTLVSAGAVEIRVGADDNGNYLPSGDTRRADGLLVTDAKRDNPDWSRCERDDYDLRPVNDEVNAYYCHALDLMCQMAAALGRRADADFVASRTRRCSPYFMFYVVEGLSRNGREQDAFDSLLAEWDRSWLGMLDFGATMGMEAWNPKVKPNLDVNHAWTSVPLHFIARWIFGVNPTVPDVTVTPHLGPLSWAAGDVPTPKGVLHVRADRQAAEAFGCRCAKLTGSSAICYRCRVINWRSVCR